MTPIRTLLTAGISVLVLIALDAILVFTLGAISVGAYRDGDHSTAVTAARAQAAVSPWQRHKPLMTSGTAKAAQGDVIGAQHDLEAALRIAPARDRCPIMVNLLMVVERRGLTSTGQESADHLARARDLAADIVAHCSDGSGESAGQTVRRMEAAEQAPDAPEAEQPAPGEEDEDAADDRDRREQEIADRSARADREQSDVERREGGQDTRRTAPDHPW